MTVISWPVFGARTRRCEPGPAPCGQITGIVAGGGAAAAEAPLRGYYPRDGRVRQARLFILKDLRFAETHLVSQNAV